jgi:hypothetical protein
MKGHTLLKINITRYIITNINSLTHDCSRGFGIIFDGENGDITITHLIWVL